MNGPIRNVRTAAFKEQLGRLPDTIRQLAKAAFEMFMKNPSHRSSRHHPLKHSKGQHRPGGFSVAITMRYRAISVNYDTFTGAK